jgi:hypothetical protein
MSVRAPASHRVRYQRRHPAGRGRLADESLERTALEGAAIAVRLCRPEAFAMTSGVSMPLDREML